MPLLLWILRLSLEKFLLVWSLSVELRALLILLIMYGWGHTLHLDAIRVYLHGRSPILSWLLQNISSPIVGWPVINSISSNLVLIILNRWGLHIDVCGTLGLCDSATESLWLRMFNHFTILVIRLITIWLLGFIEFLMIWCNWHRNNLKATIFLLKVKFVFWWTCHYLIRIIWIYHIAFVF